MRARVTRRWGCCAGSARFCPGAGACGALSQGPRFQAWLLDDEPYDLEVVRNFPEPQFTHQKKMSMHSVNIKDSSLPGPGGTGMKMTLLGLVGETAGGWGTQRVLGAVRRSSQGEGFWKSSWGS